MVDEFLEEYMVGVADNIDVDIDKSELKRGLEVEMEHTKNEKIAEDIALDHLTEIPNYYSLLDNMEKEAKS